MDGKRKRVDDFCYIERLINEMIIMKKKQATETSETL